MSTPSAGREEAPPHPDRPKHELERDHSGASPSARRRKRPKSARRSKAPEARSRDAARDLPTGTLIAVPIIIAFIVLFYAIMSRPPAQAPSPAPAAPAAKSETGGDR